MELGCKYGAASLHFLKGGGKRSVLIDCGDHFRRELFAGLNADFHVYRADSPEAQAAVTFAPDIVFVDTSHNYADTAEEFRLWSPRIASGGMMLFDDVHCFDATGREDFACGRFWNELKVKCPERCIDLPGLHLGVWGFGAMLMP